MTERKAGSEEETCAQILRVRLGGEMRTARVRSIAENIEIRLALADMVADAVGVFGEELTAAFENMRAGEKTALEDVGGADVLTMIQRAAPFLFGKGYDALIGLPFLYAPELQEFRDGASDDELLDAALEVAGIIFPLFLKIWQRIAKFIASRQSKAKSGSRGRGRKTTTASRSRKPSK